MRRAAQILLLDREPDVWFMRRPPRKSKITCSRSAGGSSSSRYASAASGAGMTWLTKAADQGGPLHRASSRSRAAARGSSVRAERAARADLGADERDPVVVELLAESQCGRGALVEARGDHRAPRPATRIAWCRAG